MDYKTLIKKINHSQALLDSMYQGIAEKHGMTFNSLMVIYILSEEIDVTQKTICDEMFLPKSTVHSIVLDFIKKGLLAFSDKRLGKEKVLVLTEEGISLAGTIMKEVSREEKSTLKYLGKEDCEKLSDISDRLSAYFEKKVGVSIEG